MASRYHDVYSAWQDDPERFWAEAAAAIDWVKPWDTVFDAGASVYGRWFVGAECNTCWNALDRHVSGGRAEQVALIHDSAITGTQRKFTYAEL
jgi:propionyl-CoA synthetase